MPRSDFYEQAEAIAQRIDVFDPNVVTIQPEPSGRPERGKRRSASASRGRARSARVAPSLPPALRGQATALTIVAQDPSKTDGRRRPLLSTVRIPPERTLPGPRNHRFYVVDYRSDEPAEEPTRLTERVDGASDETWRLVDRYAKPSRQTILTDPGFHAQNVFAVCVGLLTRFEQVLGRRVPWGFGTHHLYLVPHGFVGANAGYSPDDHCIRFGFLPRKGRREPVLSCLSHDVIAHELTHAILDGLRPRYIEPGLPDQLAFHEGFADIVALLAVFASPVIVAKLLTDQEGDVDAGIFESDYLKHSALFTLGEQLGTTVDPARHGLRQSLADVPTGRAWRTTLAESHKRGEVIVAAVSDVVARIWAVRLAALHRQGTVPLERAAEEGSKVADQVLGMCIRALDYLPPIEFEFEDFLDAILAADELVVPDDPRDYRGAFVAAFATYDIHRPAGAKIPVNRLKHPWRFQGLNHKALGTSTDEAFRFLWQNAELFDIDLRHYLSVERVLSVTRTGPDGLVVEEIIVDYVQTIAAALAALPESWRAGVTAAGNTETQSWGGGVVAFDQYGVPRHHVTKPLLDASRQNRRLRYLAHGELYDTRNRLGFSFGTSNTRQFQLLHDPSVKERW